MLYIVLIPVYGRLSVKGAVALSKLSIKWRTPKSLLIIVAAAGVPIGRHNLDRLNIHRADNGAMSRRERARVQANRKPI